MFTTIPSMVNSVSKPPTPMPLSEN